MTWVLLAEIYPLSIRARALSLMTFLSWGSNYLVVLTFPYFLTTLGLTPTFALYAAFSLGALLLFWRFIPETKGKSLEQLSLELLRDKK